MLQISQWLDRLLGLKVLRNLPTGLEALVYGDDMTPELLAALCLGGAPGHELSTLALLTTIYKNGYANREPILNLRFEEHIPPLPTLTNVIRSMMDGNLHVVYLLNGQAKRKVRVHTYSSETVLVLKENARLVVVGFVFTSRMLIVHGSMDDRFYYCENRFGKLNCSPVDACPEGEQGIDVTSTSNGSRVFTVAPVTLDSYHHFCRICGLVRSTGTGVVKILGVAEVARSLGLRFIGEMTKGEIGGLLSKRHLQNVHNRLGSCRDSLQMPKDTNTLVSEAAAALPLYDREYERTRFSATHETTAAYVEAIRSLAGSTGNVGVSVTESDESMLVKSCVVGFFRLEPSFAIFRNFRRSRVNIEVSPGCTTIFYPGLHTAVAFPDGSGTEARVRRAFRPACPFTCQLSETFGILVDLAPRLGNGRLTKIASVVSKELAADPSLVLDPVTENVVRSFATGVEVEPPKYSVIDLLRSSSLAGGRLHREAAMAGVLCQLGTNFAVAGGVDMRCFFNRCREAGWGTARGNVGVVFVDCKVDIFGCNVYTVTQGHFLGCGGGAGYEYYAKLTGPGLVDVFKQGCQQGGNYHLEATDEREVFNDVLTRPFPVKCYVGSDHRLV